MEPVSRREKIRLLSELQSGKRMLRELRPWKAELWYQHSYNPDVFINEVTGELITAAQMQERQKHKGDDVLFITVLCYEHDPE
jgi:hypothetical protein